MKEKRDITKPYFIDQRESADATLVIHREGEKLSYIHSTGHRDLSGHTVSRSYCRKKAHLISSCSFMS
jgi:hypothetical protein